MFLNIYKNQNEIEKTYEIDNYDLMYGTVEDILSLFDDLEDYSDNMELLKIITKNREKLNALLYDIFPDLTPEEARRIKVKELVRVIGDLFKYVLDSFGDKKK